MKILFYILCFFVFATGCERMTAEPTGGQNISTGSPTVIVNPKCTRNCGGASVATGEVKSEVAAKEEVSASQEKSDKSLMWLLAILAVIGAGAALVYMKFIKGKE